jgi:predicted kinase
VSTHPSLTRQPGLIIITGPVASGKTTLSQRLAADLRLPLLNRDAFKELMYDTLGWSDRAWSQKVGKASYSILYYTLAALLGTHHSCIVESNFQALHDSPKLQQLCQRYGYVPFQICCITSPELMFQRFQNRVHSGQRHPGHDDVTNMHAMSAADWSETPDLLEMQGDHMLVDTTTDATLNYASIIERLQPYL